MEKAAPSILLVSSLALLVACGGEVQEEDPVGAAGSAGSSDGGAGAAGAALRKRGGITFGVELYDVWNDLKTPVFLNSARASFAVSTAPVRTSDCTRAMEGSCRVSLCSFPAAATGGAGGSGGAQAHLETGPITIVGGAVSPIDLVPTKVGWTTGSNIVSSYADLAAPELAVNKPLVNGAETIKVTVAGGDVPAFSFETTVPVSPRLLGLPAPVPATAPDQGLAPAELDTSRDLVLTLQGADKGTLKLQLETSAKGVDGRTRAGFITCEIDATSAGFTLLSSSLQQLKSIDTLALYHLYFSSTETKQVDDWTMTLEIPTTVRDDQGQLLRSSFGFMLN